MKHLSDYEKELELENWLKTGSFVAYYNEQFDLQKKEGVEYDYLDYFDGALYCPKENMKLLEELMDSVTERAVKQDIADHGKFRIIFRILRKHECFDNLKLCKKALHNLKMFYDYNTNDVLEVYNEIVDNYIGYQVYSDLGHVLPRKTYQKREEAEQALTEYIDSFRSIGYIPSKAGEIQIGYAKEVYRIQQWSTYNRTFA